MTFGDEPRQAIETERLTKRQIVEIPQLAQQYLACFDLFAVNNGVGILGIEI